MQFVLFNGPPRSGKDTAALAVAKHFKDKMTVRWEKFSFPNKFAFAGMMQAEIDPMGNVMHYEATKEEHISWLNTSYRQWQIDFSEKFMKPLYGKDVFGHLLLERQFNRLYTKNYLCIISDCGFQIEVDTLKKAMKPNQALLITLHREGCTFAGDSREYVKPNGLSHTTIYNDKTKADFEECVIATVEEWLNATKSYAPSGDAGSIQGDVGDRV